MVWSFKLIAASLAFTTQPVGAGHDTMVFGENFNLGEIEFRIGYGETVQFGPSYYFETHQALSEQGQNCSEYCFHQQGQQIHHQSCPILRRVLSEHDRSTVKLVGSFGPNLGLSSSYGVPTEHIASAGSCRVWLPGQPPGHQPPPVDCYTARTTAPPEAYVIYDGPVTSGH